MILKKPEKKYRKVKGKKSYFQEMMKQIGRFWKKKT